MITQENLQRLTEKEQEDLLSIIEQEELERVSPKIEVFRNTPYRINCAYGGRGAGAKSWSFESLIVQRANREKLKVLYLREIWSSIKESSYSLVVDTVHRLGYSGWTILAETIISPTGSYFVFKGLKDLRSARQLKGYEGFDIFRVEEGDQVSWDSWLVLLPTYSRKLTSQLWVTWNPNFGESDPVYKLFVASKRDDCLAVWCEPGGIDNPWWYKTSLPKEQEELEKIDPDESLHVFGGQPRQQHQKAALSRIDVKNAMSREISDEGQEEIAVDPADFGSDKTEAYKRKGLKVTGHLELSKMDGTFIANEIWTKLALCNPNILIKVDTTGVGTSTRDNLKRLGANVLPIHFAEKSNDVDKFPDIVSEMFFTLPIKDVQLPNDNELLQDLTGRFYSYDSKGRRKIESKAEFKKRFGRSPDKGDAIIMLFYNKSVKKGKVYAG